MHQRNATNYLPDKGETSGFNLISQHSMFKQIMINSNKENVTPGEITLTLSPVINC